MFVEAVYFSETPNKVDFVGISIASSRISKIQVDDILVA